MDSMVCPNCRLSIEPIRVFEQSSKSKQWWLITKCPRERCKFNIDIEKYDKNKPTDYKKPDKSDDGRSFWRYGL